MYKPQFFLHLYRYRWLCKWNYSIFSSCCIGESWRISKWQLCAVTEAVWWTCPVWWIRRWRVIAASSLRDAVSDLPTKQSTGFVDKLESTSVISSRQRPIAVLVAASDVTSGPFSVGKYAADWHRRRRLIWPASSCHCCRPARLVMEETETGNVSVPN